MMNRKQFLRAGFASAVATTLPLKLAAQSRWPAAPVKVIVPFAAGGTTDIVARALVARLNETVGQGFVVENRGGAGGTIGADALAKSAPDGLTLGIGTVSTHAIAPAVMPQVPYRVSSDFTAIALMATTPVAVFAHPSLGVSGLDELRELVRTRPGTYHFGSPGNGSLGHLAGLWFNQLSGGELTHVPYRGSAPAMQDLLAGRIHIMFENVPTPLAYVRSGGLRALAVAGPRRASALPDVPTTAEAGFADLQLLTWTMLLAPGRLPADLTATINQAANHALGDSKTRARLAELSVDVQQGSSEQAHRFLEQEAGKWAQVVKRSGVVFS